jgi:peptidoglycan/LPS O-acetylase OafA/YrhL
MSNFVANKQRLVGLDLFRIAAALVTLFFHSIIHFASNYGFLQSFLIMGATVMTGFFMLSGFSLYYVYESKNLTEIKNIASFYKKRAIGILPAYYFTAVVYIVLLGKESFWENIVLIPIETLGLQSVFTTLFPISHNGGTWFISCLLICYLTFPFVSECLKQVQFKTRVALIIIASFILLYSPFVTYMFDLSDIYSNPFFRFLEFLIGASLASMMNELKNKNVLRKYLFRKITIIVEMVVMIVGVTLGVKLNVSLGNYMLYSWICLPIFILMLPSLAGVDFKRIQNSKLVSYLSAISYDFFLAQFFVWSIMKKIVAITGINNNVFNILVSLLVCVLIAMVIHEIIEKPSKKVLMKMISSQLKNITVRI